MTDRSAVDTIRGYFYQFDLSILSLLQLSEPSSSIAIECIEDIDIRTATEGSAVQCKYYAKTEYNHSVIKEAVMYMLSHFKETKTGAKPPIRYVIRGHYLSGHDKLNSGFDVEFLKKNFLTYTSKKVEHFHYKTLGLDDDDLKDFLALLTIDIRAPKFEDQFRAVIRHLEIQFSCTPFSAEFFFYNNALRVIRELSIEQNAATRTITKDVFLKRVNTSSVLFNEWFVQKRGKRQHLAALRKEYFSDLNVSPYARFFLVEVDPASYCRDDLKHLIFTLAKKWSKVSKYEPKPFCPYVFVQGLATDELLALKKDLRTEGFKFIDGYDYQDAEFSAQSITQKATYTNGLQIKIVNSKANLEEILSITNATRKVYQFYLDQSYFDITNLSMGHVKIQVEQLLDIKEII
jgi:hypothetical protein